jgi:diguanylate cyclase (GGDEF)-like protein
MNETPAVDPLEQEAESYARLVEALYGLVFSIDLGEEELSSGIAALENTYGSSVYSELIHLLCHLRFEPREARRHWDNIREHRRSMQQRLGTPVDLTVALMSYFVEVNRQLDKPKIVELRVFQQTQASAYRDDLTGLCNYRYFREHLEREVHRSRRDGTPLSLVMIDIDNFKEYNDANGHDAGNDALARMAVILAGILRKVDVLARYGGEEFAMLLPSTPKTGAREVAERARRQVEEHIFLCGESSRPVDRLTVSMGIATLPADARQGRELVRKADQALYRAKARGKNRVQLHAQSRRSFSRVKTAVRGRFHILPGEELPLTTIDVSEGGLGFVVDRSLPLGAFISVELRLPGTDREIVAAGRVVRAEDKGDGNHEAAIQLVEVPAEDRLLIEHYVRGRNEEEEAPSMTVERGAAT